MQLLRHVGRSPPSDPTALQLPLVELPRLNVAAEHATAAHSAAHSAMSHSRPRIDRNGGAVAVDEDPGLSPVLNRKSAVKRARAADEQDNQRAVRPAATAIHSAVLQRQPPAMSRVRYFLN